MASKKTKSLVSPYVADMFKGVRPGWKKIILSDNIKPVFKSALDDLDSYLKGKGVTQDYIDKNGLETYIRPKPKDILNCFKYCDPNNVVAFIIGQDPYPQPMHAEGLCFSVPKKAGMAKSALNLFKALVNTGELDARPDHSHLSSWAKQGIMLLNRYLTRSPVIKINEKKEIWIDGNGGSEKECLHTFWEKFTSALIKYFTSEFLRKQINHENHFVAFMLWGNPAKSIATSIYTGESKSKVEVMTWAHPAAQISESDPASFVNCTHFQELNKELVARNLPKINWDPDYAADSSLLDQFYHLRKGALNIDNIISDNNIIKYDDGTSTEENKKVITWMESKSTDQIGNPIVVCTDGSCPSNGRTDAVASFAAYFPTNFNGKPNGINTDTENCKSINIYGLVPLALQTLVKEGNEWKLISGNTETKCTNNRGELLGIIHALLYIINTYIKTGIKHPVILIADSEYSINSASIYIWEHARAGRFDSDYPILNKDLLIILWKLLQELAATVPNEATNIRDKLFQPNESTLTWKGLTILHQHSHPTKSETDKIVKKGGVDYEAYLGNSTADNLCALAIRDKITLVVEHL